MVNTNDILQSIKQSVQGIEPGATLILYGSYARGDYNKQSDIDLLILLDKTDRVTYKDRYRITAPIHDMELKTGLCISSILRTKTEWENQMVTPFYENVKRDGVLI